MPEQFCDNPVEKRQFFFLPCVGGEEAASLRLPKKLEASTRTRALVEAEKYGHGIVVIKIAEV